VLTVLIKCRKYLLRITSAAKAFSQGREFIAALEVPRHPKSPNPAHFAALAGQPRAAVPTFNLQHSRNMQDLRLTLFVRRCYSRGVPFGRGFL
jgi:hypothetical protein